MLFRSRTKTKYERKFRFARNGSWERLEARAESMKLSKRKRGKEKNDGRATYLGELDSQSNGEVFGVGGPVEGEGEEEDAIEGDAVDREEQLVLGLVGAHQLAQLLTSNGNTER